MFILNGKKYIAFRHWYNATWRNERAVEIPVILDKIKENRDKKFWKSATLFGTTRISLAIF